MSDVRTPLLFITMAILLTLVGVMQSWSLALAITNLCIISAVMALGVNLQWGYAGLLNVGIMGFAGLGGATAMLISMPPVTEAWHAGGTDLALATLLLALTVIACTSLHKKLPKGRLRQLSIVVTAIVGLFLIRAWFLPAVQAIESVDPAQSGYLGGLGLPIIWSWLIGGAVAAGAAWVIGKVALGLRADYLAIATLGISEIIIALLKNEDWLTRGVKNVNGLPRPVPYELDLQQSPGFIENVTNWHGDAWAVMSAAAQNDAIITASGLTVKLAYTGLFTLVLLAVLWICQRAQNSPWGRMMRAIRDNENAAAAMGKNIPARHLQVFVLGSAMVGVAGAMLTTLDGQFTPGSYQPLRYTFIIWVMVIVGGSGNNFGAILGAFAIWFLWIEAEPVGVWLLDICTAWLGEENTIRQHLMNGAQYMRVCMMGLVLLLVMRFSPRGILPEQPPKRRLS